MITEEERQSIINAAVEKTLLILPEIVGNLIMNQANLIKINRKFYEKYPEFATNKGLVASVVEKVEGDNPGLDYEQILTRSVPIIRDRISTVKRLDVTSVSRPDRNLASLDIGLKDHGEL